MHVGAMAADYDLLDSLQSSFDFSDHWDLERVVFKFKPTSGRYTTLGGLRGVVHRGDTRVVQGVVQVVRSYFCYHFSAD
jgi:hypothetical protein